VFGSLVQLRKSHLIPPPITFRCLVAWLGRPQHCPTQPKKAPQPGWGEKLKSSFSPQPGRVRPATEAQPPQTLTRCPLFPSFSSTTFSSLTALSVPSSLSPDSIGRRPLPETATHRRRGPRSPPHRWPSSPPRRAASSRPQEPDLELPTPSHRSQLKPRFSHRAASFRLPLSRWSRPPRRRSRPPRQRSRPPHRRSSHGAALPEEQTTAPEEQPTRRTSRPRAVLLAWATAAAPLAGVGLPAGRRANPRDPIAFFVFC
jgi:hypothetical protein